MGKASRRKKLQRALPGSKAKSSPQLSQQQSTTFQHEYGPDFLRAFGPLFLASWWIPSALAQTLAASGLGAPPPVSGAVLIDTGADGTCISIAAADRLGLKPTRIQDGFGLGGAARNAVYFARFE